MTPTAGRATQRYELATLNVWRDELAEGYINTLSDQFCARLVTEGMSAPTCRSPVPDERRDIKQWCNPCKARAILAGEFRP